MKARAQIARERAAVRLTAATEARILGMESQGA